jgi:hypothetical protein
MINCIAIISKQFQALYLETERLPVIINTYMLTRVVLSVNRMAMLKISILVCNRDRVGHPSHEKHDATAVVPDEKDKRMIHLEVFVSKRSYPLESR